MRIRGCNVVGEKRTAIRRCNETHVVPLRTYESPSAIRPFVKLFPRNRLLRRARARSLALSLPPSPFPLSLWRLTHSLVNTRERVVTFAILPAKASHIFGITTAFLRRRRSQQYAFVSELSVFS